MTGTARSWRTEDPASVVACTRLLRPAVTLRSARRLAPGLQHGSTGEGPQAVAIYGKANAQGRPRGVGRRADTARRIRRPALAGAAGRPVAGTAAASHRTVPGLPPSRRPVRHRDGDAWPHQEQRLLRRASPPAGSSPTSRKRSPASAQALSVAASTAGHRSRVSCSPSSPRHATARPVRNRPSRLAGAASCGVTARIA